MTHITEEQLVAYALDDVEAGTRAAVEAHVETCAACRASLDEIRATLDHAASLEVPARGDDYGASVWDRIESRLSESRSERGVALRHFGTSAPHLGTPALRHSGTSSRAPGALAGRRRRGAARRRCLLAGTLQRRHRRCASHADDRASPVVALAGHRGHSRTRRPGGPRRASRSHRAHAGGAGQQRARPPRGHLRRAGLGARSAGSQPPLSTGDRWKVSRALRRCSRISEPVLLEIANSPSQLTSDEFEAMRDRIEARSLVFKVRVTGADIRARQRALIRRGESQL